MSDKFGRGERVRLLVDYPQLSDIPNTFLAGDTGTVVYREPLAKGTELYHVTPDVPRVRDLDLLVMAQYMEAE